MKALVVAGLCAVLLAGCGDDGDETPTGEPATAAVDATTATSSTTIPPEESTTTATAPEPEPAGATDPVTAATAVLTASGTPEQACDLYVTPNFIETAYGGRENCIESRRGELAEGLRTTVAKDNTRLVAIPKGGPYDGVEIEIVLVRDGDTYRVDALEADIPAGP